MTTLDLFTYRIWLIKVILHIAKRTRKLDLDLLDACWTPYEYTSEDRKGDT